MHGRRVSPALRSIAAVVAGFVAASVVMVVVESVNGRVLSPGAHLGVSLARGSSRA